VVKALALDDNDDDYDNNDDDGDNECGAVRGMRICRGNRSTCIKPAPI
jgi:hypothetical protein